MYTAVAVKSSVISVYYIIGVKTQPPPSSVGHSLSGIDTTLSSLDQNSLTLTNLFRYMPPKYVEKEESKKIKLQDCDCLV